MEYPVYEFKGTKYWSRPGWQGQHETLRFHDSWDWIMPVWIKFRDLFEPPNTKHEDWINSLQWYLFSSDSPKRFAERLAYAIKWYNSTKTNG